MTSSGPSRGAGIPGEDGRTSGTEFGGWIKTSVDKLAQVIKAGEIKAD